MRQKYGDITKNGFLIFHNMQHIDSSTEGIRIREKAKAQ